MSDSVSTTTGDGDTTVTKGIKVAVSALAVVFVVLRFYTRFFTKAGLGWDDWFILISVISEILTIVFVLLANAVDAGGNWVNSDSDPDYHYTPENIFHLKLFFVASILYFTISSSAKLSILIMYNRLFSVSTTFRYQVFVVGAVVVGFWLSCTVTTLTKCIPMEWSWLSNHNDARYCLNYNIFWMASGAAEAFVDVFIIAIPVRIVLKLQIKTRTKASVAAVFALGAVAVITGLVKTILGYIPGSRIPSYLKTEVWTTVHVSMSIVCACLPVCWPLMKSIFNPKVDSYLAIELNGHRTRTLDTGGDIDRPIALV
ncbi:hypothetical protein G7Y89_g1223 [Cudoniella acicularis]|uniref:Rhodopsin domain-containing protein n=1 Tax=Cudoniella acicularis TaxID=354080 RepID=A0A8H4W774_9HELO|nr:hypothetical protein G7Y89_g1223 [Cudoniella acicularis]